MIKLYFRIKSLLCKLWSQSYYCKYITITSQFKVNFQLVIWYDSYHIHNSESINIFHIFGVKIKIWETAPQKQTNPTRFVVQPKIFIYNLELNLNVWLKVRNMWTLIFHIILFLNNNSGKPETTCTFNEQWRIVTCKLIQKKY